MNKEQDYASDTDESDEDFQPDNLAGDAPGSEDEAEDSEANEVSEDDTEDVKKKPVKRKNLSKKIVKQKTKYRHDESDGEEINTSRRATRQTGNALTNGNAKTLEKDELLSDDEDKSRTNALWADFLKDVKPTTTCTKVNPSNVENKCSSSTNGNEVSEERKNETQAKITSTSKAEAKKIAITEVVNFAGEDITVQREVDASSIKENKAATIPASKKQPFSRIMPGIGIKRAVTTPATGSATGLGSILNQIGKKQKLSVLEKSQMDWKNFKQSEGIDEQLQTFNKGKDGYLERQDFLQRTDLRQFEIEKNLRQTNRRPF